MQVSNDIHKSPAGMLVETLKNWTHHHDTKFAPFFPLRMSQSLYFYLGECDTADTNISHVKWWFITDFPDKFWDDKNILKK